MTFTSHIFLESSFYLRFLISYATRAMEICHVSLIPDENDISEMDILAAKSWQTSVNIILVNPVVIKASPYPQTTVEVDLVLFQCFWCAEEWSNTTILEANYIFVWHQIRIVIKGLLNTVLMNARTPHGSEIQIPSLSLRYVLKRFVSQLRSI